MLFSRALRWLLAGFITLIFSGVAGVASAQVLRLDQLPSGPLGSRALYLQEKAGEHLTLAQAREALARGEFHRDDRSIASFGLGARPVWVYLELQNPLEEALALRLGAGVSWIDRLEVDQVQGDRLLASWQSGDEAGPVDGSANVSPGQGFMFPLAVPSGRSEIFIRAQTPDPMVLPLTLELASQTAADDRKLHYGYGLLYGFLLALIVYNAMLYFGLRKGSYLHYALYLLSFIGLNLSYTGHGYALWWVGDARFQRYVTVLMIVGFAVCGLNFADHFLDLRTQARRLRAWGVAASGAAMLAIVACAVFDWHEAAGYIAFSILMAFIVVMMALGVWAFRRGYRSAGYFLAAALFGMTGAGITTLAICGWAPLTSLTFHGIELGLLVEAILLALALAKQMRDHEIALHEAEEQARTDTLTGLANRRAFFERARGLWSMAQRGGRPLSVVMLDIDHFKDFNDRHGHDGGDLVLVRVAELLRRSCRAGDVSARWGGEEFLLLLPETDLAQAIAFAERLRVAVESSGISFGSQSVFLSISLGVAPMASTGTLEELIAEADRALYRAKSSGRNRVKGPEHSPAAKP